MKLRQINDIKSIDIYYASPSQLKVYTQETFIITKNYGILWWKTQETEVITFPFRIYNPSYRFWVDCNNKPEDNDTFTITDTHIYNEKYTIIKSKLVNDNLHSNTDYYIDHKTGENLKNELYKNAKISVLDDIIVYYKPYVIINKNDSHNYDIITFNTDAELEIYVEKLMSTIDINNFIDINTFNKLK